MSNNTRVIIPIIYRCKNLFKRRYSTTSEERKRLSRIDENLIIQNHDQKTESQSKDSGKFSFLALFRQLKVGASSQ